MSALDRGHRFLCAAQAGAQLFFAAGAAQIVFSSEIAALPHDDPRRALAADQVGQMLGRVDCSTVIVAALTVLISFQMAKKNPLARRRALWPLLAGLCATASIFGTTPAIHALRAAGRVHEPIFGMMHALSTALLAIEIALFVCAALGRGPLDGERHLTVDRARK